VKERYWRTIEKRHWVFATPEGAELRTHSKTHIQRHIKVKGTASPYDGNLLYWSQRLKTHPMMHATKAKLLQRQQGKCRWCELIFKDGDLLEIDHIQPRSQGGADRIDNIWLLHLHCHDERHAKLAETEKLRKQLADAGINIQ
jgi:RNA-directed DNA polymerase